MKIINEYISIQNKSKDVAEIDIYGDIMPSKFWDDCVTPQDVKNALKECGTVKTLEIHINSYGGSTSAGNGMISIIDDFKKRVGCRVESYIEGMCASMASGVAMVADKIYMSDNALLLIHKPLVQEFTGNANDMISAIEYLNKTEDALIKNYMRHWNRSEDELREALAKESIYTADEALELGLCDEIISGVKIAASANGVKIGNQNFGNNIAALIKDKYPNTKIEKEEKELSFDYDENLKNFGIDESAFATLNLDSNKVLEIVNLAKEKINPEPVKEFIGKDVAIAELGCEDITAEQVLAYAKAGMNPVDTTEISNKATAYDKIVSYAKETALTWAIKAQGDSYNEAIMKKFLDVLNYEEIVQQTEAWKEEAKRTLNAGKRVSVAGSVKVIEKAENLADYKI